MPRRARLLLPGAALHLIQRGNNRSVCFHAEADYLMYPHVLAEQADRHDCAVHALCLMTNHVHLLLTPDKPESPGFFLLFLSPVSNRRDGAVGGEWVYGSAYGKRGKRRGCE